MKTFFIVSFLTVECLVVGGKQKDRLSLFFFQIQTEEQVQTCLQTCYDWYNRDYQFISRKRLLFLYPCPCSWFSHPEPHPLARASAEGPGCRCTAEHGTQGAHVFCINYTCSDSISVVKRVPEEN